MIHALGLVLLLEPFNAARPPIGTSRGSSRAHFLDGPVLQLRHEVPDDPVPRCANRGGPGDDRRAAERREVEIEDAGDRERCLGLRSLCRTEGEVSAFRRSVEHAAHAAVRIVTRPLRDFLDVEQALVAPNSSTYQLSEWRGQRFALSGIRRLVVQNASPSSSGGCSSAM